MSSPAARRGFTLIELLVVIAIIAILAAILFPVFAKAREKARQTTCLNNQRQIATAILMHAQDYDETLPQAETVWGDLSLEKGAFICPTAGKRVSNAYLYNSNLSSRALGDVMKPEKTWLTADGMNGTQERRHSGSLIKSFVDGHVVLVQRPGAEYTDQAAAFSWPANNLLIGCVPVASVAYTGAATDWSRDTAVGISVLTDGQTPSTALGTYATVGGTSGGKSIVYDLPSACDISDIYLFFGWSNNGRNRPCPVSISVATAKYAASTVYTPLTTTAAYVPAGNNLSRIRVFSPDDYLANNVQSLKFEFGPAQNNYIGLGEIAVVGEPVGSHVAVAYADQPSSFGVAASDLINGKSPVFSAVAPVSGSGWTRDGAAGLSTLTDGVAPTTAIATYATVGSNGGGLEVVYDLGGTYKVSEINLYFGWSNNGRNQPCPVTISTASGDYASNPTYTQIATTTNYVPTGSNLTKVTVAHSNGENLAVGVRSVKIRFGVAQNYYVGIGEIDVLGTP